MGCTGSARRCEIFREENVCACKRELPARGAHKTSGRHDIPQRLAKVDVEGSNPFSRSTHFFLSRGHTEAFTPRPAVPIKRDNWPAVQHCIHPRSFLAKSAVRPKRFALYWCTTPDGDEDWFVVAESAATARRFHENAEGYDRGEADAERIAPVHWRAVLASSIRSAAGGSRPHCHLGGR